ncbi:MAG: hypothetical protein HDS65_06770 [Bacteroidales bacterium]|nr:hypothetical protein [Bacteroidales bacterium]
MAESTSHTSHTSHISHHSQAHFPTADIYPHTPLYSRSIFAASCHAASST